jgi:hypothetical protein
MDVPTLGPQLDATFAASGNFAFAGPGVVVFDLVPAGPVALSGSLDAAGDFQITAPGAQPFDLVGSGPLALAATFAASGAISSGVVATLSAPPSSRRLQTGRRPANISTGKR